MFRELAQYALLVRPRVGDVENVRPIALVKVPRLRADQQVQLLAELQSLGHLWDHPGPAPVGTRWRIGVVGQQVDRHAHCFLPSFLRTSTVVHRSTRAWLSGFG